MVPDANKSPGLVLHPPTVWWASCCFMVQYICYKVKTWNDGMKSNSSQYMLCIQPTRPNDNNQLTQDTTSIVIYNSDSIFFVSIYWLYHFLCFNSVMLIFVSNLSIQHFTSTLVVMTHKINVCLVFVLWCIAVSWTQKNAEVTSLLKCWWNAV